MHVPNYLYKVQRPANVILSQPVHCGEKSAPISSEKYEAQSKHFIIILRPTLYEWYHYVQNTGTYWTVLIFNSAREKNSNLFRYCILDSCGRILSR
jgi:hypothetical protein